MNLSEQLLRGVNEVSRYDPKALKVIKDAWGLVEDPDNEGHFMNDPDYKEVCPAWPGDDRSEWDRSSSGLRG